LSNYKWIDATFSLPESEYDAEAFKEGISRLGFKSKNVTVFHNNVIAVDTELQMKLISVMKTTSRGREVCFITWNRLSWNSPTAMRGVLAESFKELMDYSHIEGKGSLSWGNVSMTFEQHIVFQNFLYNNVVKILEENNVPITSDNVFKFIALNCSAIEYKFSRYMFDQLDEQICDYIRVGFDLLSIVEILVELKVKYGSEDHETIVKGFGGAPIEWIKAFIAKEGVLDGQQTF